MVLPACFVVSLWVVVLCCIYVSNRSFSWWICGFVDFLGFVAVVWLDYVARLFDVAWGIVAVLLVVDYCCGLVLLVLVFYGCLYLVLRCLVAIFAARCCFAVCRFGVVVYWFGCGLLLRVLGCDCIWAV